MKKIGHTTMRQAISSNDRRKEKMHQRAKRKARSSKIQKAVNSWKATCETLSDPQLLKDIKEGLEDIKAGRVSRVRDDIKNVRS